MSIDPSVIAQFRLTAEEQAALEQLGRTAASLRQVVKQMKAAGLDVSTEEAELDRAEKIRAGLLKQFGSRRSNAG